MKYMLNFIAWIVVGGLAGWIASKIMKTDASMGVGLNIIVGVIGAVIGGWVVSFLLDADPELFSIGGFVTAILGSVILLAIVKALTGRK
ncbi:TPA: GlsB/YeaQ/YmgE family stress response membrane protein [Candidatus Saccharibacteria bacterium]|nr:GlsB/YeaQ/YmgE family stress response membrane protein [Candidatus Saccharibacteria bacterium]